MPTHVRIDDNSSQVIKALIQPGGLYPAYSGLSRYRAVNILVRKSPDFQQAQAQMESEKNPRPGGAPKKR